MRLVLALLLLTSLAFTAKPQTVEDAEEYRVYAAVLFGPKNLQGISGNSYTLLQSTISGVKLRPATGREERVLADNYNSKNAAVCTIDPAKLKALVPEGKDVSFVARVSLDERRSFTSLSRVGFNSAKTKAVVSIRHIADPEMGVGYLVYLEKSKTGKWEITDVERNFMA